MSSSRTDPRARLPRTATVLARGWVGFAGVLLAGCVQGPLRTVRSTAEKSQTGDEKSTTWSNLVELGVHDTVGPELEYRVNETLVTSLQDRTSEGVSASSQTTQNRPSAELVLNTGPLRWSQRFELFDNHSLFDPGDDNRLLRTDFLEKLEWSPPGLPTFTGWVNYRTVEDRFYVDQKALDALLQLQDARENFDYQYTFLNQQADDLSTGVDNDRSEHTLRATYHEDNAESRLNTTVSVFLDERRGRLKGATSTTPGIQVFALQGLSLLDQSPPISTLTANPALVDGNDAVSAGVNIGGFGSGGEAWWNLGARLPPGSTVDTIELTTQDEIAANFVPQYVFSVWTSPDNTFWTQVTGSAVFVYDAVQRSFRFSIPGVGPTYIKLVNSTTPPGAPAVLVTELRFFTAPTSGATSIESQDSTRNVSGALSWRANDQLTLGYDVFVQTADTRTEDTRTRDETRFDNGLWALWAPHQKLDASLRLGSQDTRDTIVQDESLTSLNGVVSLHPLETLDVSTSYTTSTREVDGATNLRSRVAQVLASARLLDTLRTDFTLEKSEQDDVASDRLIEHFVVGASLVADLSARLELTLAFRDDDATVSGSGAGDIPDPTQRRTEMIWLFRPSEQLTAQLELDWVDNFAGSGLDQRARVDWIPFENGKMDVQLDWDHISTESSVQSEMERVRALVRYTITPRAFLELSLSAQDPVDQPRTEIMALAFAFSS